MTDTDVLERETDACAMIARCHRHQFPHEYGGPALAALGVDDAIALAPMIVDRGPMTAEATDD